MVESVSELSMAVMGPRTWTKWEDDARNLPCLTCAERGVMEVRGIHDLENIHLDKPVHDMPNFRRFVGEVKDAAQKAGIDGVGRNSLNQQSKTGASEPKLVNAEFVVYGGAVIEKAVDVGVKATDATPLSPAIRNSTIYNIVAAIVGGGLAYYWRMHGNRGIAAAAFSAAAVNNLIEDGAKAAGLPGATGVGAVRRISVPFVPVAGASPALSPSQAAAQSGAPALF